MQRYNGFPRQIIWSSQTTMSRTALSISKTILHSTRRSLKLVSKCTFTLNEWKTHPICAIFQLTMCLDYEQHLSSGIPKWLGQEDNQKSIRRPKLTTLKNAESTHKVISWSWQVFVHQKECDSFVNVNSHSEKLMQMSCTGTSLACAKKCDKLSQNF